MEIKRDVQNRKLYIVDNDEILLKTGKLGAEFIIYFYTKNNNKRVWWIFIFKSERNIRK